MINVASIAGLGWEPPRNDRPLPTTPAKAHVVNFTRALAAEWGKYEITVNAGWRQAFFRAKMSKGVLDKWGR